MAHETNSGVFFLSAFSHETPAANNEPFTGAVECRLLNSETVHGKMLRNRFSFKPHSDADCSCKSQRRKEGFVFFKHVYTGLITACVKSNTSSGGIVNDLTSCD